MIKNLITLILFIFLAIPCFSNEFSLGIAQKSLYTGMPQPEVVSCLGAPDFVAKTSEGCETWVYERSFKSTHEVYDKSWLWLLFFGRRKGCQHTEISQKSINVVLNFDKNSCLENFSYKSSNF